MSTQFARHGMLIVSGPPLQFAFPEAATQTFVKGDLVYRSSGYLTVCGTDPTMILGIAVEDGHNDASPGLHSVLVQVITGLTLLEMNVYHGTPGNNVIEAADHGALYGIVASSHKWLVDKTETVNTRVRVQQFKDPLGTVSGVVLVQVLPTYREFA